MALRHAGRKGQVRQVFAATGVEALMEGLLGPGNLDRGYGAHVRPLFPQERPPPRPGRSARWHVDQTQTPYPFDLLVGVALSDQSAAAGDAGNLHVFPGSHHLVAAHFREQADRWLRGGDDGPADPGAFKRDLKCDKGTWATRWGKALPMASEAVLLRPGDVVLLHHHLAHHAGDNTSPHVRYQVYARTSHVRKGTWESWGTPAAQEPESFRDQWRYFEALDRADAEAAERGAPAAKPLEAGARGGEGGVDEEAEEGQAA